MLDTGYGVLNSFLQSVGFGKIQWLGQYTTAMSIILIYHIWKYLPFWTLIFLSGLKGILPDVYEAGRVDGATPLQLLRRITIPMIRGLYIVCTLISIIWTMGDFITVYLMTGGGPGQSTNVLATIAYRFAIFRASLFTYMVPSSFIVIPFYSLMVKYGLVNSYLAVILAETTFATPYCIWVLSEFFKTIPIEVEEAAIVDGASHLRIFMSIVLPLTAPALVALATYAFIFAWNEFLYVLVLINSNQLFTIPVGLSWYLNQDSIPWGMMMAESTLFSIPPIILYYAFQRYMVSGLAMGAVK